MDQPSPSALADSIAAAQAWWREAGVDLAYHDEPRGWLSPVEPQNEVTPGPIQRVAEKAAAPARPLIGGDPAHWPADLATFHRWWLEEPSLDAGGMHGRVAARGPANAPLMIVVPMPEADDNEVLLAGPQGRLLDSMLRAMGLRPDEAYVAAALPRHMPLPGWAELAANGLGEVLLHHVALAAPKGLLVLGSDILPLLGHDPTQVAPAPGEISIQTVKPPLLSSYAPGRLLDHARLRADLWRRWLEWTDGGSE